MDVGPEHCVDDMQISRCCPSRVIDRAPARPRPPRTMAGAAPYTKNPWTLARPYIPSRHTCGVKRTRYIPLCVARPQLALDPFHSSSIGSFRRACLSAPRDHEIRSWGVSILVDYGDNCRNNKRHLDEVEPHMIASDQVILYSHPSLHVYWKRTLGVRRGALARAPQVIHEAKPGPR